MSTYQIFLKELADHLRKSDVEVIKFLFNKEFPAGKAEQLDSSIKLLNAMDHAKLISSNDISRLELAFNHIPRKDLIPKLNSYKEISSREPEEEKANVKIKVAEENTIGQEKQPPTENIDDSDEQLSLSPSENLYKRTLDDVRLPPYSTLPPMATPDRMYSSGPQFTSLPGPDRLNSSSDSSPGMTPSPNFQLMTPDFFRRSKAPSVSPSPETRNPMDDFRRQRSSAHVRPEEYSMERVPHGDCVIISNRFDEHVRLENGTILKERDGTEKDVLSLTKTFEYLQYKVTILRNQTAEQMINTLKYYASLKEHEKHDSFVVCILSHGYDGGIYGNKGGRVSNKMMKSIFTGDHCPYLISKPKLFFIQACQGECDGKGVRLEADAPSAEIVQDHLGESGTNVSRANVYQEIISTDADFLFSMATTPGTISWRHPIKGSWFVQTLCEVFQMYADGWSLMDMLLKVNDTIALMKDEVDDGSTVSLAKQMSNFGKNTLRKKLYFFPERRDNVGVNIESKIPSES